jgi:hypothetical protein
MRILLIVTLILSLAALTPAQKRRMPQQAKAGSISKDHPSVYITFVRTGKREPEHTSESDQGVWLRLHNNTYSKLLLNAYGAGGYAFARGDEQEIGMFYGVEKVEKPKGLFIEAPILEPSLLEKSSKTQSLNTEKDKYEECDIPPGNWCHSCSIIELKPGKSLLFSVPREYLCRNHKLYLVYQYEWEQHVGEPEHRVYFMVEKFLKHQMLNETRSNNTLQLSPKNMLLLLCGLLLSSSCPVSCFSGRLSLDVRPLQCRRADTEILGVRLN